ncbi:MAG: DNA-binding protein WhiA [Bacilli bacterium]|nr:DNA-binding protein WhiA [Bacilli bacterium]
MSFAQDVKHEIANLDLGPKALKAELYGIVKLKSSLIISNRSLALEFVMSSLSLARRIVYLFRKVYQLNLEFLVKEQKKLDYKNLNYLKTHERVKEILEDLDIIDADFNFVDGISSQYDEDKDSVLRGMFLARGSVNDPGKSSYHLEIVCNQKVECDYVTSLLDGFDIPSKTVTRPKGEVVYIKKGEAIGDFLKIIGSSNMLFYYENERIKRDLNNVVNRIMNCDLANSDKTFKSAQAQLADIELIQKNYDIDKLSIRMQEMIRLRTLYPESSLQELSDVTPTALGRYIGKSGVSHGMKDIQELAASIRGKRKK